MCVIKYANLSPKPVQYLTYPPNWRTVEALSANTERQL